MSNDFIHVSQRRSAKKKYTYKKVRQSAMMAGALPSPPADDAENARPSRKNATARSNENTGTGNGNGTPPSAQRPPASQDSSTGVLPVKTAVTAIDDGNDVISADDIDDDALLGHPQPTKSTLASQTKVQTRNAFTVLANAQATMKTTPAARPPTTNWTADEEWTVVEGMRDGLSQAQIRALLPVERSGSAIRGKKRELQEKYGPKLKEMKRPIIRTPAPPVPLRKAWTYKESVLLRKCMSQGLSDRDIQAMHFPNRTEDSVIGKLRKLREAAVEATTNAANTALLSSRIQDASSSPAILRSSSQTVQRSSPAQAALKRKADAVTEYLPSVQEESVDADLSDDAHDDSWSESFTPASPAVAERVTSDDHPAAGSVSASSPAQSEEVRTAYVVIPEQTDMSDVVDLRAGPPLQYRGGAHDLEARYMASTPPFLPGQEHVTEGVLGTTKLGLWREAYSRCRGDIDAAYRMYETLRTDEHMMQAVCNLDYDMINGVKAVRMRRLREDAIREGRSPPTIPISDQPQHWDLFGEKHYGKYYTYTPWPKETEEMYLNEPITFGPRPVPSAPVEYIDPMQAAMHDDDFDEERNNEEEYDVGGYVEVGYNQAVDNEESDLGVIDDATRAAAEEPFHGHVSEIDDEDDEFKNVAMSHSYADSASAINISKTQGTKRKHFVKTSSTTPVTKRQKQTKKPGAEQPVPDVIEAAPPLEELHESTELEQSTSEIANAPEKLTAPEETSPLPSADKQQDQKVSLKRAAETTGDSIVATSQEEQNGQPESIALSSPGVHSCQSNRSKREHSLPGERTVPSANKQKKSTKGEERKHSMPVQSPAPPSFGKQTKQKANLTAARSENTAPSSLQKDNKQKKQKESLEAERSTSNESTALSFAQKHKLMEQMKKLTGKKGVPVSRAARRRQRKALRRSDASLASEVTAEPPGQSKKEESVPRKAKEAVKTIAVEEIHPEDNPSQWMRDIVKNAKHKPPPVRHKSPPPVDPNNLFGRGDLSDSSATTDSPASESESESDSDVGS